MSNKKTKVWFVTACAKGLGASVAKQALNRGHLVVATGRNPTTVREALGDHENLLICKLDVLKQDEIDAAVKATVDRFGKIDVLCNNAGVFFAGFFENTSDAQMRRQYEINTYGTMNVTRAVLPIMRKQRAGLVITTTSAGALLALEFCGVYAASKFALEGWMEALRYDLDPFNIQVMLAEPGFMRTAIFGPNEIVWPDLKVDDYEERTQNAIALWKTLDRAQPGDPDKYAIGLLEATETEHPPFRFIAGADAIEMAQKKADWIVKDINKCREIGCTEMSCDD